MLPKVSIIIPCYNSGNYLPEAIASIENYPDKNLYEVIITDDGSTDKQTLEVLEGLKAKGYFVLHQENKGPASARNNGVRNSKGKFLLFLDSDNKIKNNLIDKGIEILEKFEEVGVVYGDPFFFGSANTRRYWKPKDFDMEQLLMSNYIDMCSIVRKSVWEEMRGLDENRAIIGHEDWDFWIRIAKSNWKFYHLNEIAFEYRITDNSLVTKTAQGDKYVEVLKYIYDKHLDLVIKYLLNERYHELYENKMAYDKDRARPLRSFLKFFYLKYFRAQGNKH